MARCRNCLFLFDNRFGESPVSYCTLTLQSNLWEEKKSELKRFSVEWFGDLTKKLYSLEPENRTERKAKIECEDDLVKFEGIYESIAHWLDRSPDIDLAVLLIR